uniref:CDP-glucose 4,6-dehydratase n=1 Tax=Dictyoglomus thermophilum TaxID=14 RepID=A0A7C3RLD4_DICTH
MANIFQNYRGRKVLVTGHTGFKGSWLTLWLSELGAEVIGYSLEPPTNPSLFEILNLKERIIHIVGDIRDEESLRKVFRKYKPDIVFHLAAQPLVRYSYIAPRYTYEVNVMGTVNLLEAVRDTDSVKVAIIVTSDKCYENKEWFYGYREIDPMGGYDPYSSSKGCVELIVSVYKRSFMDNLGIALSSVRAGNVIGGGDWQEDRLIPDCIRALSKGEAIKIRKPKAIRPWQYVLEPLYGYLLLGVKMLENREKFSGAWNFGPSDTDILTVEEVTKKVIEYWGEGEYEILEKEDDFHEATLLKLDCSKAHFLLNWYPVYDINEALKRTVNWYKRYYDGYSQDMYAYSLMEIQNYIRKRQEKGE